MQRSVAHTRLKVQLFLVLACITAKRWWGEVALRGVARGDGVKPIAVHMTIAAVHA